MTFGRLENVDNRAITCHTYQVRITERCSKGGSAGKREESVILYFLKASFFLAVIIVIQVLGQGDALAWGAGVHTVTALSLLNNLGSIVPSVAATIVSFPREYLYGCLAADFFVGKGKKPKPGHLEEHPHTWEGGFRFLREAESPAEEAFVYGFFSHLAADIVAHNFYVPSMLAAFPAGKMGHIYWEAKADYLVGPCYVKLAKDVLSMDNGDCDGMLNLIAGKHRNGYKAKKCLYIQSVKLSDYFFTTREIFFTEKRFQWEVFNEYIAYLVGISCRLVRDFLSRPQDSPCLGYDPTGAANLSIAMKHRLVKRVLMSRRKVRSFNVDSDLLKL